jgi:hypothetical protein
VKHFNQPPSPNKRISEVISGHVSRTTWEADLKLSNIVLGQRARCVYKGFDRLGKAAGQRLPET